jgi:hypothetical protein
MFLNVRSTVIKKHPTTICDATAGPTVLQPDQNSMAQIEWKCQIHSDFLCNKSWIPTGSCSSKKASSRLHNQSWAFYLNARTSPPINSEDNALHHVRHLEFEYVFKVIGFRQSRQRPTFTQRSDVPCDIYGSEDCLVFIFEFTVQTYK